MLMTPAEHTKLIISQVAKKYGLLTERLLSPQTIGGAKIARQELVYRLMDEAGITTAQVGEIIGCQAVTVEEMRRRHIRANRPTDKARAA